MASSAGERDAGALGCRLRGNDVKTLPPASLAPVIPAKAGTQGFQQDKRSRRK